MTEYSSPDNVNGRKLVKVLVFKHNGTSELERYS